MHAVITGAASGLGKQLALQFGQKGFSISGIDIHAESLEHTAQQLQETHSISFTPFKADITDKESVLTTFEQITSLNGPIDLLINNAGITHINLFKNSSLEAIENVINVNLMGAIYCTKNALQSIVEQKGSIINISSVAGFGPLYGRSAYAASKHALHGFFDTLRTECPAIHIMVVCPSYINTNIHKSQGNKIRKKQLTGNPLDTATVAKKIIIAWKRKKRVLLVGRISKVLYFAKKIAGTLYDKLMIGPTKESLNL